MTFRFTAKGPEGLLKGKRAVVYATRGGRHAGTAADTQTGYIRDFPGFLGVRDVTYVGAEGLAPGPASRDAAIARAHEAIDALPPAAEPLAA